MSRPLFCNKGSRKTMISLETFQFSKIGLHSWSEGKTVSEIIRSVRLRDGSWMQSFCFQLTSGGRCWFQLGIAVEESSSPYPFAYEKHPGTCSNILMFKLLTAAFSEFLLGSVTSVCNNRSMIVAHRPADGVLPVCRSIFIPNSKRALASYASSALAGWVL